MHRRGTSTSLYVRTHKQPPRQRQHQRHQHGTENPPAGSSIHEQQRTAPQQRDDKYHHVGQREERHYCTQPYPMDALTDGLEAIVDEPQCRRQKNHARQQRIAPPAQVIRRHNRHHACHDHREYRAHVPHLATGPQILGDIV